MEARAPGAKQGFSPNPWIAPWGGLESRCPPLVPSVAGLTCRLAGLLAPWLNGLLACRAGWLAEWLAQGLVCAATATAPPSERQGWSFWEACAASGLWGHQASGHYVLGDVRAGLLGWTAGRPGLWTACGHKLELLLEKPQYSSFRLASEVVSESPLPSF